MRVSRRNVRVLFIIGLVIGIVAVPVLGALLGGTPTTGTVTLETNSGAKIHVQDAGNMSLTEPFPDDNTIEVATDEGNATFASTGSVNATVDAVNLTGTWTKVSGLNVTQSELYINPSDKAAINISGDADRVEFRSMSLDDGNVDFVYAGTSGTTSITVRGVTANTQIRAVESGTGTVLGTAITDSSGTATFTSLSNSEHSVELETGANAPVLTDAQPNGNVSSAPSTFSVNVEDADFPGDNVTAEFYYEGSLIDTNSTSSDGRVSTSNVPAITSGVHDWSVVATDENGNQDVLNATVGVPGTLYIRNETNASELVDSPVNVTVRFLNGTVITQRTTTTGTIDMTGLATEDFIVTVEASQDYYKRVKYFQNIIGDKSVYLLNTSYTATETRFILDDPTGEFPSESYLIIKKAINRSGTLQYETIHSDKFGAEGVTADLEQDERYLISVRSPTGKTQQIGPYRSDVSETVTVRPGAPSIELGQYTEEWAANATLDNRTLEFRYNDPQNETQQVTVFIHEKGNKSNQLRPNVSYYDLGELTGSYTLTEANSEKTWVVKFITERDDGTSFTAQDVVENNPDLVPPLSREWRLIVGVTILLISAGAFSILNAGLGGVIVSIEGGLLWYIGFLDGATTGMAVVLALFISVLFHVYSGQSY